MSLTLRKQLAWAVALIGICVVSRLVPHIPSFTAVSAAALFAGWLIQRRALALFVPLAAMAISDLFDKDYELRQRLFVYAALSAPVFFNAFLGRSITPAKTILGALACAAVHYLLANLGVWLFSVELNYPKTLSGLFQCYGAALPFLVSKVLGNLLWASVFYRLVVAVNDGALSSTADTSRVSLATEE